MPDVPHPSRAPATVRRGMRSTALRLLTVLLLLSLALGLLAGAHLYIARRLILDPGLTEPWAGLGLGLIAVLGLSLLAQPLAERTLAPAAARWVAWPASLWMGFAFLLLLLLGASELLLGIAGSTAAAADGAGADPTGARVRAAAVLLLALLAGAVGMRSALRPPRHARVEVRLRRWPRALDGFRIVQISDVHIGPLLDRRFAAEITRRVNALEPDLVAVTGDLVDGSVASLADEVAPFAGLRGRHGVFFVTGNHDHYSGASAWVRELASLGMRPLRNERVTLGEGDARFELAGVDDHRGNLGFDGGEDLPRALEGRDPTRPLVLLAHDPSTFKRASRAGVDLQLSGHTHGGQIWPFGYLVRLVVPFLAGLYRRGEALLYVSRGTGFWGPPLRLGAPAEITEIALRASAEAG